MSLFLFSFLISQFDSKVQNKSKFSSDTFLAKPQKIFRPSLNFFLHYFSPPLFVNLFICFLFLVCTVICIPRFREFCTLSMHVQTGSARAVLYSFIIKESCFSGCIYTLNLYLLWLTGVMVFSAITSVMNSLLVLSFIILGFSSLQTSGMCRQQVLWKKMIIKQIVSI